MGSKLLRKWRTAKRSQGDYGTDASHPRRAPVLFELLMAIWPFMRRRLSCSWSNCMRCSLSSGVLVLLRKLQRRRGRKPEVAGVAFARKGGPTTVRESTLCRSSALHAILQKRPFWCSHQTSPDQLGPLPSPPWCSSCTYATADWWSVVCSSKLRVSERASVTRKKGKKPTSTARTKESTMTGSDACRGRTFWQLMQPASGSGAATEKGESFPSLRGFSVSSQSLRRIGAAQRPERCPEWRGDGCRGERCRGEQLEGERCHCR